MWVRVSLQHLRNWRLLRKLLHGHVRRLKRRKDHASGSRNFSLKVQIKFTTRLFYQILVEKQEKTSLMRSFVLGSLHQFSVLGQVNMQLWKNTKPLRKPCNGHASKLSFLAMVSASHHPLWAPDPDSTRPRKNLTLPSRPSCGLDYVAKLVKPRKSV